MACLRSIAARSRKISWRSPVSASASREYRVAASRSLDSSSRHLFTDWGSTCAVVTPVYSVIERFLIPPNHNQGPVSPS